MAEDFDATWMDYFPVEAQLEWLRNPEIALQQTPPQDGGMLPDVSDPDLAAYTALGSSGAKRANLERQLAMAQQLRGQGAGEHTSGWGAALGGLGGIVNNINGGLQQKRAQQGLEALTSSEDAARARFARSARAWKPEQAANLGVLSGDPVLGAFGREQGKQDATGLRALTLKQGERRLSMQEQEMERKVEQFAQRHGLDAQKVRAAIAQGWKGLDLREQEIEARGTERTQKNEDDLRKEVQAHPVYKEYLGARTAFQKLEAAATNPSPAGDISLITNFMKSQDPGSTVREGEFATAANSGGVSERVRAKYNELLGQGRLTPEQRQDLLQTARRQYEVTERAYNDLVKKYQGLAGQTGASPSRVVLPDTDLTKPPGTTPVGSGASRPQPSEKDRAAMQWLQSNPNDPRAPAIRKRLQEQGLMP